MKEGSRGCGNIGLSAPCQRDGKGSILSQVVGRHVHGLDGSDGASLRGGDAFLHAAHVDGEGGLVSDSGGNASKKGRDFGACLREARRRQRRCFQWGGEGILPKDVVDEEKDILALVSELFGDGQALAAVSMPMDGPGARRTKV